ncbi:MAG: adenylosuccinate synthase [Pyrinomonadaceae bacterium]|nr:adenylosuccinate synthase [Pyrinomonadaceae bacterium]MCX7638899.1 adenylosuccinate synthase [Pyrinomonadaceae bacterium]MDW8304964.1 adenylosuccinate synthase [Acidobacteriota bacterium]
MIVVVIGAQWGDEGKGKVVDLLSDRFDIVVRYQGGHNAGHSVHVGGKSFVLRLLPSGIIHEDKICVLGNGMVIDPKAFFEEIEQLEQQGISITSERLKVSSRAHLIMPYHRALDHTSEERLGNEKIGTTLRGIGPAYEDKAGRRGIRVADALWPEVLRRKIERNLEEANRIIVLFGREPLRSNEIFDEVSPLIERMRPFVCETADFLAKAKKEGKRILLEGAQATLLDVDHGTYPYVTSSNPTAGGACVGAGIPPHYITGVLGIVRTYATRVGEGPFPTEMLGEEEHIAHLIRQRGNEYGSVTRRPRRCGWFDAVATRYAANLNGFDSIALTKLDVLDELDEIKVCVGYELNGKRIDHFPASVHELRSVKPIYESLRGWRTSTLGIKRFEDLPKEARDYIEFISTSIGVNVGVISTGPEREQTIIVKDSVVEEWLNHLKTLETAFL